MALRRPRRGVYLTLLGNAYEGAVNLNLDSSGRPKEMAAGS